MRISSRPEQDQPLSRSLDNSLGVSLSANPSGPATAWLAGACAAAFLMLAPLPALAQGKVEAHCEASLSGISVGRGTWGIEIGDDFYSASAQGATAGLLTAFSGGTGSGSVQGRIVNGALVPGNYVATVNSKKSETIRISLANG